MSLYRGSRLYSESKYIKSDFITLFIPDENATSIWLLLCDCDFLNLDIYIVRLLEAKRRILTFNQLTDSTDLYAKIPKHSKFISIEGVHIALLHEGDINKTLWIMNVQLPALIREYIQTQ